MGNAKVVSLDVRPFSVSNLCFDAGGILGELNTQLGASAPVFDFNAFYATLGAFPTVSGDASRTLYDAAAMQAFVKPFALAALRAETMKSALGKALNARQNAYYAKYGNAPAIISTITNYYSPSVSDSKPNRLAALSKIAQEQATSLAYAYFSDGRTGVVKNTGSVLNSSSQGHIDTQSTGQSNEFSDQAPAKVPLTMDAPPAGGGQFTATFSGKDYTVQKTFQEGTSGSSSSSSTAAGETQTIVNTDYGYRVPWLESQAQNERAQISLIDQQSAQFIYGQSLPNLATVFRNELNSIDSDIYRIQIGYLNTILMSPIAGTVTGIYKNPGDAVGAGEPVVRVEDRSTIYLLATVIYRGPIVISVPPPLPPIANSSVTIQTPLFDAAGPLTTLTGSVVAARGCRDDDKWELVVKCSNLDSSSNPIFPLGYRFDYDDTTVSIA